MEPDIGSESRVLPTRPAFDAPVMVSPSEYRHDVWYGTRSYSYRKQIARQLRTQYAEGIYDNPVTLKSRLTVTQGHWKRNH